MKSHRLISFATLAVLLLLPFLAVEACGPDFEPDTFVRTTRPDDPQAFAQGHLGILQPGFDSNDLAVAYRYLNGGKLSEKEQLAYIPPTAQSVVVTPDQRDAEIKTAEEVQPVNQWQTARAKYAAADGEVTQQHQAPQSFGNGNVYYYPDYLNCPDAAFKTAALTVDSRAATWGAQSPYLKDWIGAQDAVFSNCDGKSPAMPAAAPAGSPALLHADRAYQIAAANFYAGKYEDARRQFEAIAEDKTSPWHIWGEYLAARSLVRLAFAQGKKTDPWSGDLASFDLKTMQSAQQILEALLQHHDPALGRQVIVNELNLVRWRTEPDQRVAEIAAALAGPAPDPNFRQDLDELDFALRKKIPVPNPPPLHAWIAALRSAPAGNPAFAAWQQSHSMPWLVAALAAAGPKDSGVPEMLTAAARIEPSSPAFDTVAFHRIRLLIALDRADEARTLLDGILPRLRRQQPSSALNAFLGERLEVARTFDEFLTYAPRTMLESSSAGANAFLESMARDHGAEDKPASLQFDEDSIAILNRQTPLSLLVKAFTSPNLPPNLRQNVTLAAWVRSVILDDEASAAALAPHLPESIRKTAGTDAGFPAVLTILQNPGLRPYLEPGVSRLASYGYLDRFRDNWWCHNSEMQYYTELPKPAESKPVSVLSAEEQKTGEAEYQRLVQRPCAPTDLGERVLDYAQSHPSDPNVPEALALAVRATRFGVTASADDKDAIARNTTVSKAAFQLLHKRYPKSSWTAKTPYYY